LGGFEPRQSGETDMGNISSKPDDGSALYLKDQIRCMIFSDHVVNAVLIDYEPSLSSVRICYEYTTQHHPKHNIE
jgi:hypothetical protein